MNYLNRYLPAALRMQLLQEEYCFTCDCPLCSSIPDVFRAFVCPSCKKGVVCPVGVGKGAWKCDKCTHVLSSEQIQQLEAAERAAIGTSLRDVKKVIAQGILNEVCLLYTYGV